jgi:hypothetical protein
MNLLRRGGYLSIRQVLLDTYDIKGMLALGGVRLPSES